MITFTTQEDFENAVMAVLAERLDVAVYVQKNEGWTITTQVEVVLSDSNASSDDGCIAMDRDEG